MFIEYNTIKHNILLTMPLKLIFRTNKYIRPVNAKKWQFTIFHSQDSFRHIFWAIEKFSNVSDYKPPLPGSRGQQARPYIGSFTYVFFFFYVFELKKIVQLFVYISSEMFLSLYKLIELTNFIKGTKVLGHFSNHIQGPLAMLIRP